MSQTFKLLDVDTFNECIKGEAKYGGLCFLLNKTLIESLKGRIYDRETTKMAEKE